MTPAYHVLQRVLGTGGHVQAGGQDDKLGREDGQLAALGLAGLADDADDVTPLAAVVQLLEAFQVQVRVPTQMRYQVEGDKPVDCRPPVSWGIMQ